MADSRVAPQSGIRTNYIIPRCITIRFKMLMYLRVRSAFEATRALLNTIIYFRSDVKSRFLLAGLSAII
jgi:hypothetical protein